MTNLQGTSPTLDNIGNGGHGAPRSAHNLSKIKDMNVIPGELFVLDCFHVTGNTDINAKYKTMVKLRSPLPQPLMSGMRVIYHVYAQKSLNMWKGFKVWADGGKSGSGQIAPEKPKILLRDNNKHDDNDTGTQNDYSTLNSLADQLGFPITTYDSSLADDRKAFMRVRIDDSHGQSIKNNINYLDSVSAPDLPSGGFCADAAPFVMYQQIDAFFYEARNLLLNNDKWYPEDEDDFILPFTIPQYEYDAVNGQFTTWKANNYVNMLDKQHPTWSKASLDDLDWDASGSTIIPLDDDDVCKSGGTIKHNEVPPLLTAKRFRQFRGDRFTTALPFPDLCKGEMPKLKSTIGLDISDLLMENDTVVDGSPVYVTENLGGSLLGAFKATKSLDVGEQTFIGFSAGSFVSGNSIYGATRTQDNPVKIKFGDKTHGDAILKDLASRVKVDQTIVTNDIRQLLVMNAIHERMALTDGTYNSYFKQFYGVSPHAPTLAPTYITGSYDDLGLSIVTQNSETSETSMLGKEGSKGLALGELKFNYHANDDSWIMVIGCVVPDVYYCNQGIDKMFTKINHDDFYLPIYNNLGAEGIKNKEIMMSSTSSQNNDIFGWTERFSDMRSRRNSLHGLFALPSIDNNGNPCKPQDSRYHMKRRFTKLPTLNNNFVHMSIDNIDWEIFANEKEIPFNVSSKQDVYIVSELPTMQKSASLGISY